MICGAHLSDQTVIDSLSLTVDNTHCIYMAYLAIVVERFKEFDERISPGKLHSDLCEKEEKYKKTLTEKNIEVASLKKNANSHKR